MGSWWPGWRRSELCSYERGAGRAHADSSCPAMLMASAPESTQGHHRGCQYFRVTGIFNKLAFISSFPQCLKLLLFASNHGAGKLNRPHWFDYPFFTCWQVSASKPMFPNAVDLNPQWICCWFPAPAGQLKSFFRSPLREWLLNQWLVWGCLWVTLRPFPPSCVHHPTSAFTTLSQCSQPCPPTTPEVHSCLRMLFENQMKSFSIVGPHCSHINIDDRADGAFSSIHESD